MIVKRAKATHSMQNTFYAEHVHNSKTPHSIQNTFTTVAYRSHPHQFHTEHIYNRCGEGLTLRRPMMGKGLGA